ncbi:MAG: MFS transporter, partial [Acetobacteraceae bacterium]|nr:MFS transporter [Acetobacteraceae bacterium]
TYAAKNMPAQRFGLWGGIIQAVGNTGMIISASPLALLVEYAGWPAGFLACAGLAAFAAITVALVVRETPPDAATRRSLQEDAREVIRLGFSRSLRAPIVMALTSFAIVLGVRGLWGGPWLMEVKGLARVEAGHVLLLCTIALIIGPLLAGILERRFQKYRGAILVGGHIGAVATVIVMAQRHSWHRRRPDPQLRRCRAGSLPHTPDHLDCRLSTGRQYGSHGARLAARTRPRSGPDRGGGQSRRGGGHHRQRRIGPRQTRWLYHRDFAQ